MFIFLDVLDEEVLMRDDAVQYLRFLDFKNKRRVNEMSLQQKVENEVAILRELIDRYKRSADSESICIVMDYGYSLQELTEIYELSKKKEGMSVWMLELKS